MAEAVASAGEVSGKASRLPSKRVMLIGGAVAAVLAVGGGGAAVFLLPAEKVEDHAAPAKPAPLFYTLPELTVNFTSDDGRPRYLKMKVAFEIADKATLETVEPNLPRILDIFQVYLRELRAADLEGSASLYRLREELVRRVNLTIAPKRVEDVLFQEILVQ